MYRKSLIATMAVTLTGAAHAAASVVNACGIGATDTVDRIAVAAPKTITAGEGLIDSGTAHLTAYRVALDHSMEGPWDTGIDLVSTLNEPVSELGESVAGDIAFHATPSWTRLVGVSPLHDISSTLQLEAKDLILVSTGSTTPLGGT